MRVKPVEPRDAVQEVIDQVFNPQAESSTPRGAHATAYAALVRPNGETNATEHEGDCDVIAAIDHDDIEKKWVKLNGQNCGTEKNGRHGWTSGFKKLFG